MVSFSSHLSTSSLAILLSVFPAKTTAAWTRQETLGLGDSRRGSLTESDPVLEGRGPHRTFLLSLPSDRTVRLNLDSVDFDAYLRIETAEGELIAQDDDGGIETNASLALEGKAGKEYRILAACASRGGGGEFELHADPETRPAPKTIELRGKRIAFRREAAARALARGSREKGAEHLIELGVIQLRGSEYAEARESFEAALKLGKDSKVSWIEARSSGHLGEVFRLLGEFSKAKELMDAELSIALASGNRWEEMIATGDLGNVLWSLGDFPGARSNWEKQLRLARELGSQSEESVALRNLGMVYPELGEIGLARESLARAAELCQRLGDSYGKAFVERNLGFVARQEGAFEEARQHFQAALALAREVGCRLEEARNLGNLGNICLDLEDYHRSRELTEAALRIAEEIGAPVEENTAIGNLGSINLSLGETEEAKKYLERQIDKARKMGARPRESNALTNLGFAFLHEDTEKAIDFFRKRLALEKTMGHRGCEAEGEGHLGLALFHAGNFEESRERLNLQLSIAQELGLKPQEGYAYRNLGLLHLELGDLAEARSAAQKALDRFRALGFQGGSLHSPLCILGRSSAALGDAEEALGIFQMAKEFLNQPGLLGLPVEDRVSFRSQFLVWDEILQDATALRLAREPNPALRREIIRESFRESDSWKGRGLLAGIVEHRQGGRSEEATRLRKECRELLFQRKKTLDEIPKAIADGKPAADVETLRKKAQLLQEEVDRRARTLKQVSPEDASVDFPEGASLERVRASLLSEGTVLIDYKEGERNLFAFLLAGQEADFLDLGPKDSVERDVEPFLAAISSPSPENDAPRIAEIGGRLFQSLLEPILKKAGSKTERLIIIPSSLVARFPFEALVSGQRHPEKPRSFSDVEFVVDRFSVCYGPSSSVLSELRDVLPRRNGKVLILADPVYPQESAGEKTDLEPNQEWVSLQRRKGPDPRSLVRLEKTKEEALLLARLFLQQSEDQAEAALRDAKEKRSAAVSGSRFDLFLGESADRGRMLGGLKAYSMIHLAAHGFVDDRNPRKSGLALSFLPNREGYVTIADVLELDLEADAVVLSACETAKGKLREGEGLESLARAFMYAGARSVVASLWQVTDRSAAQTMEAFYRFWISEGRSAPEALREAKRRIRTAPDEPRVSSLHPRRELGHPFFWAPFIYIGPPN